MSIRSAVRRWAVPAIALGSIVVPLLIAGCDAPDDFSWMLQMAGCPDDCVNCYHDLMGYPPLGADVPEAYGNATRTTLGNPKGDDLAGGDPSDPEGGEGDEGGDPTDTPPGATLRPRLPDAVARPKVDPHTGSNVPQLPSYPTGPKTSPTPTKKY